MGTFNEIVIWIARLVAICAIPVTIALGWQFVKGVIRANRVYKACKIPVTAPDVMTHSKFIERHRTADRLEILEARPIISEDAVSEGRWSVV
jgi:hypothetical protein